MEQENSEHHVQPLPGWACIGVGIGFVALLGLGLLAVRMLGGA